MFHSKWLLLIIWIVGLAIRLPNISRVPLDTHHIRQSDTSAIIQNMQRSGIDLLHPQIDWGGSKPVTVESELPLYNALVTVFLQDTPIDSSEGYRKTRLLSLGIWSMMVWVSVAWIRRMGPNLTIGAMLVLVFSPMSIVFSQTIQPDFLALTLMMIAVERMSLLNECVGWKHRLSYVSAVCCYSLAVMVKGTMLFALPMFLVLINHEQSKYKLFCGLSLSIFLALGWYYYAHNILGASGATFGIWSVEGEKWATWTVLTSSWTWGSIVQSAVYCLLTPLGAILMLIGISKSAQSTMSRLVRWPFVFGLFGMIVTADGFRHHEYYHLYFLPWVAVMVSNGLLVIAKWLYTTTNTVRVLTSIGVCLLCVYSSLTSVGYVKQSMVQDGRILEAAKALNNTLPKDANLLVVDRYAQSIVYHSDRTAWRLNRLDEPVVSMLVEDGVEYIAVLDPIEGDSDVQILQSIQKTGVSSALDSFGTLIHMSIDDRMDAK